MQTSRLQESKANATQEEHFVERRVTNACVSLMTTDIGQDDSCDENSLM